MRDFWSDFIAAVGDIKELRVTEVLDALNDLLAPHIFPAKADGGDARPCPSWAPGSCRSSSASSAPLSAARTIPNADIRGRSRPATGREAVPPEGIEIGVDPETGETVTRHEGRFGPYVQLGKAEEGRSRTARRSRKARTGQT